MTHRSLAGLRTKACAAVWFLACLVLFTACSTAHYVINPSLTVASRVENGYAIRNLRGDNNAESLVVIVAVSGGGFRAAALAHAVLTKLQRTRITWDSQFRSLLDEVDLISAVSGGSLAAAYYAWKPDRFVQEFPDRVLALDMQSSLIERALSPKGLWQQTSSHYGRADLLQELLDQEIFHGARFGDLRRRRPMVYLNATETRNGQRFEFTQDQFDNLCSDLDAVSLSRAVSASMAVPVLLSPITIWNHRHDCPVDRAMRPLSTDVSRSRYIHLLDGGLADNTGLSALFENVQAYGGLPQMASATMLRGVRKRVIIVASAQLEQIESDDDSSRTPGLVRQLKSLINVPIDRHAESNILRLSNLVQHWKDELRDTEDPVHKAAADAFHIIELSLSKTHDPELGRALNRIPTGLNISAEHLQLIHQFVDTELATNRSWQELLQEIGDPAHLNDTAYDAEARFE